MKKNDIKALHQKTIAELQTMLEPLQKELVLAKLHKAAGKLDDVSKPGRLADDIARIKTIITEKRTAELEEDKQ